MAAESDRMEVTGEGGEAKPQSPIKKVLILIGIGAFLYWRFALMPDPAESDVEPKPAASAPVESIDLASAPNQEVAITYLTKRMEQIEDDQKATAKKVEEFMDKQQTEFRAFRNESRIQNQQLISEVTDIIDDRVRSERDQGLGLDNSGYPPLPGGGADGGAMTDPRSQDPFQYKKSSYAGSGPRRSSAQPSQTPQSASGEQAVINSPPVPPGWDSDESASPSGSNPQSNAARGDGQELRPVAFVNEDKRKPVTVPAFSFVRAKLLHGVACPVSNSLGEEFFGKAPIVIPVTGEFYGPNGDRKSIGNAHLFGFCMGVPSEDRPTGKIKVEQLSYVDSAGDAQTISVNGYVLDVRDNDEGIRGVLESRKMGDIAWAAGASAITAVGNLGVQSQYEQQTSSETGNVLATLSPDKLLTAGGAGAFAAAASDIASFFKDRADQTIDVVHVTGGTPLQFVVTEKFQVMTLTQENESDGGARRGQPIL